MVVAIISFDILSGPLADGRCGTDAPGSDDRRHPPVFFKRSALPFVCLHKNYEGVRSIPLPSPDTRVTHVYTVFISLLATQTDGFRISTVSTWVIVHIYIITQGMDEVDIQYCC